MSLIASEHIKQKTKEITSLAIMTLTYTLLVVAQVLATIKCSHLSLQGYTPLRINEIACTAEKLKVSKLTKTKFEVKLDKMIL